MAYKQVLLIRKDLNMRRGKEIAQGSHASLEFVRKQIREQAESFGTSDIEELSTKKFSLSFSKEELNWLLLGSAKICLRVESEEELVHLHQKAQEAGLKSSIIVDSGKTEFNGQPTATACAIGPDLKEKIDKITGNLRPY